MAPDPRDTRVLIPRTRRALEGISVLTEAEAEYGDEAVNAAIADAIARLLLYMGSIFGAQLEVTERDDDYGAPIAWQTSRQLTEPESSLVSLEAALDHVYRELSVTKQSETIRDEGQEWSYSIGAGVLTERLKGLRTDRDRALEAVLTGVGTLPGMEDWISFIEARDARVSALIEPWVQGAGFGGQLLDAVS